jgi:hypothetical protein
MMYGDSTVNDSASWERTTIKPPGYVARRNADNPRSGVVFAPAIPRTDPTEVDAFTNPPRPGGRDADD